MSELHRQFVERAAVTNDDLRNPYADRLDSGRRASPPEPLNLGSFSREDSLDSASEQKLDPVLVQQIVSETLKQVAHLQTPITAIPMPKDAHNTGPPTAQRPQHGGHTYVPDSDPSRHTPPDSTVNSPLSPRENLQHQHEPKITSSTERPLRPKMSDRLDTETDSSVCDKVWRELFDDRNNPTERLDQVLRGIATYLIEQYEPKNSLVVTPEKMLKWYKDTSGPDEYYPWDMIFDHEKSRISRMYRSLSCQHHLVQFEDHERPEYPGLTQKGFSKWSTLMIQAHPQQEFERMSKAFKDMPISNPDDRSERFPKRISKQLFPDSDHDGVKRSLRGSISDHAGIEFHDVDYGSKSAKGSEVDYNYKSAKNSEVGSSTPVANRSMKSESTKVPERERDRTDSNATTSSIEERVRAPYAGVPSASVTDEEDDDEYTEDVETPLQNPRPIERERKPYTAAPGQGKVHTDESRTSAPEPPLRSNASSAVPQPAPTQSEEPLHRSGSFHRRRRDTVGERDRERERERRARRADTGERDRASFDDGYIREREYPRERVYERERERDRDRDFDRDYYRRDSPARSSTTSNNPPYISRRESPAGYAQGYDRRRESPGRSYDRDRRESPAPGPSARGRYVSSSSGQGRTGYERERERERDYIDDRRRYQ